jgi:hypothetical protein
MIQAVIRIARQTMIQTDQSRFSALGLVARSAIEREPFGDDSGGDWSLLMKGVTTMTDDECPKTADGQPLALEGQFDTGSKSWEEIQRDKWRLYHRPSYPPCTSARTTLHARDASDHQEEKYEILFLLQHGRQHPAERRANGYSEGWDGQKVRQESVSDFRQAQTILSQVEVKDPFKRWAVEKAMQEPLQGFSRHYEGIDGAVIGFATLYKYDTVEMGKKSYLVDEAEEMLDIDGEQLVD